MEHRVSIDAMRTNSPLAQARALYPLLGREGLNLLRDPNADNSMLDQYFLDGVVRTYDLPDGTNPRELIDTVANKADDVMNKIVSRIFPNNGKLIRPTEATLRDFQASYGSAFANDFEHNRRLGIMHIVAQQELRMRSLRYNEKRQELDYVLANRVCDPASEASTMFFSEHDPSTLATVGLSPTYPERSSALIKKHEYVVYDVPGIGKVTRWTRLKGLDSVVLKALGKSGDPNDENYNNGFINLNRQVPDSIGGILLVDEDENMAPVMERTYQALVDYYGSNLARIDMDHKTSKTRGSALDSSFFRLQVYTNDMLGRKPGERDTPMEIIIDGVPRYTDRIFNIGTRDPESGLYTGPAEDMYGLRRIRNAVPSLIPIVLQDKVMTELPDVAEMRAEELRTAPGLVRPTYCHLSDRAA